MWFLSIFVGINVFSILVYILMHQQVSRIVDMQQRTFHMRHKVSLSKRSALRTRTIYLIVIIALVGYTSFLYGALNHSL